MWRDRVLNSGPLALKSDALPTALRELEAHSPRRVGVHLSLYPFHIDI